jgi:hypothetical protein
MCSRRPSSSSFFPACLLNWLPVQDCAVLQSSVGFRRVSPSVGTCSDFFTLRFLISRHDTKNSRQHLLLMRSLDGVKHDRCQGWLFMSGFVDGGVGNDSFDFAKRHVDARLVVSAPWVKSEECSRCVYNDRLSRLVK